MADTKITSLQPPQAGYSVVPATDVLPIVVIADPGMATSGSTRKVTVNQLLGAGGTATLASATITGDLTVDTNVLKVNTTTNRVGINTTTPTQNLQITGSGDPLTIDGCSAIKLTNTVSGRAAIVGIDDSQNFVIWNVGTEVSETIKFLTGGGSGKEQYRITHGGVFNWYDGAGSARMTLNSTGLGVGVSPGQKLDIIGSLATRAATTGANQDVISIRALNLDASAYANAQYYANSQKWYYAGASLGMTLDSSGNVGIGVTPSAWGAGAKMIDLGVGSAIGNAGSTTTTWFSSNSYQNGTNWIYKNSAAASYYAQLAGQHQWFNAPSGTAGASAAVTSGQSYTVSVLGSSTLAQWQSFFSALTVLPTVGQVIAATATGSIVGGGTVTQNITFTQAMTLDASGNLILLSSNTPATLTTNGQLTVNATSNTNLRFSYRGSDGTTRVANITLA